MRLALVAAVLGLLPRPAAATASTALSLAAITVCRPGGTPAIESTAVALARSAMQARFRPVYWNSFQVSDSLIQARLDNLIARSPAFAQAIGHIRETRFLMLVATAGQADLILGLDCLVGPVANRVLSDVGYMAGTAHGDVVGAFVRINIDAIRAIANRRVIAMARADTKPGDTAAARIDDVVRTREAVDTTIAAILDDVLIHEIWGHVVPVAEHRHDSGRCPDPEPDQDPLTACVIRRENRLRAELGLMPIDHYGIVGW